MNYIYIYIYRRKKERSFLEETTNPSEDTTRMIVVELLKEKAKKGKFKNIIKKGRITTWDELDGESNEE
jgi:hypothetical protein